MKCERAIHTTFSGSEVVVDLPMSEIARSSSGGGFSLKTSRPLLASSASSGSLRLQDQGKKFQTNYSNFWLQKTDRIWRSTLKAIRSPHCTWRVWYNCKTRCKTMQRLDVRPSAGLSNYLCTWKYKFGASWKHSITMLDLWVVRVARSHSQQQQVASWLS